jgi:hypothetical protein
MRWQLIALHLIVEAAHLFGRDAARERGEDFACGGDARSGVTPDENDGLVRRKVMAVVFKLKEVQRRNKAVRGVARDQIDLTGCERAVSQG